MGRGGFGTDRHGRRLGLDPHGWVDSGTLAGVLIRECYTGGEGQKPVLNQLKLKKDTHCVLSTSCRRDWSFKGAICALSLSDFSSPLASAFAAPPQTDRLWCQGPRLRSSGLTGCRRHNPGETDCSLLSLICENPKWGPRALSRSNRSVTGWWEGQCNWRVRSINRKTGRGGPLKMQTVSLHSRVDTCLYLRVYTLTGVTDYKNFI